MPVETIIDTLTNVASRACPGISRTNVARAIITEDKYCDAKIPVFPIVFIPRFGQETLSARVYVDTIGHQFLQITLDDIVGHSLHIAANYRALRGRRIVTISESDSTYNRIRFPEGEFDVGRSPSGLGLEYCNDGVMIVADPIDCTPPVYHVLGVTMNDDWRKATAEGRISPKGDYSATGAAPEKSDIANLLEENPALGFKNLQEQVQRLPVLTRGGIRLGYFPGHNDNPARITMTDTSINVRFLYPDMQAIATEAGTLKPETFLKCLKPGSSFDAPDVIDLAVTLNKETVNSAVTVSSPDLKNPIKLIVMDTPLAQTLTEQLCTPPALAELFASLSPEKEKVETPAPAKPLPDFTVRSTPHGNTIATDENTKTKGKPTPIQNQRTSGSQWQKKHHQPGWKQR